MRLIGIYAKARSGKDELADILCKTYGFEKASFAEEVKRLGIEYFCLTHEQAYTKRTPSSRKILQGIGNSVRQHLTSVHETLTDGLDNMEGESGYPAWVEDIAITEFQLEPEQVARKKLLKYSRTVLEGIQNMFTEEMENFLDVGMGSGANFWIQFLFQQLSDDIVYVITDVRYKNEKELIEDNDGKTIHIIRENCPAIEAGAGHASEVDLDDAVGWDVTIMNEYKTDWRIRLETFGANAVRKFQSQGFFTPADLAKFKVKLVDDV